MERKNASYNVTPIRWNQNRKEKFHRDGTTDDRLFLFFSFFGYRQTRENFSGSLKLRFDRRRMKDRVDPTELNQDESATPPSVKKNFHKHVQYSEPKGILETHPHEFLLSQFPGPLPLPSRVLPSRACSYQITVLSFSVFSRPR